MEIIRLHEPDGEETAFVESTTGERYEIEWAYEDVGPVEMYGTYGNTPRSEPDFVIKVHQGNFVFMFFDNALRAQPGPVRWGIASGLLAAILNHVAELTGRHVIDGYNVEFLGARPAKAGEDY
jgi:hypothetical protein